MSSFGDTRCRDRESERIGGGGGPARRRGRSAAGSQDHEQGGRRAVASRHYDDLLLDHDVPFERCRDRHDRGSAGRRVRLVSFVWPLPMIVHGVDLTGRSCGPDADPTRHVAIATVVVHERHALTYRDCHCRRRNASVGDGDCRAARSRAAGDRCRHRQGAASWQSLPHATTATSAAAASAIRHHEPSPCTHNRLPENAAEADVKRIFVSRLNPKNHVSF